jgi:hypothetical protein
LDTLWRGEYLVAQAQELSAKLGLPPMGGLNDWSMKIAALLLLVSGWFIVLTAIALLHSASRAAFVYAGTGVEVLGLGLLCRAHMIPHSDPSQGER